MYSARGVIALRARGVISVKLRGVIKCPEVMHDRMRRLPASCITPALGRVLQPLRVVLCSAGAFGAATQAVAGCAPGSHRTSAASHARAGRGVGGAARAGCAAGRAQCAGWVGCWVMSGVCMAVVRRAGCRFSVWVPPIGSPRGLSREGNSAHPAFLLGELLKQVNYLYGVNRVNRLEVLN